MKRDNINIGIINCEFGNIASLINAVNFLKFSNEILIEPKNLKDFSHLILPGVGSFNESVHRAYVRRADINFRVLGMVHRSIDYDDGGKHLWGLALLCATSVRGCLLGTGG